MAQQISYLALAKGTPVIGSDGSDIGTVAQVVAEAKDDIFRGLEVSSGIFTGNRFAPADLIDEITDEAVRLSITADEADAKLPPQD